MGLLRAREARISRGLVTPIADAESLVDPLVRPGAAHDFVKRDVLQNAIPVRVEADRPGHAVRVRRGNPSLGCSRWKNAKTRSLPEAGLRMNQFK